MSKYSVLEKKIVGTSPGNILAQLLRDTIKRLGLLPEIPFLVDECIEGLTRKDPNTKRTKSSLDAEILSEDMTFKTFINVLVNILRVDEVDFVLDVKYGERSSITSVKPKIRR